MIYSIYYNRFYPFSSKNCTVMIHGECIKMPNDMRGKDKNLTGNSKV